MALYYVSRWQVSKANAEKHLEMIRKVIKWLKQNPKLLYFIHSTYCVMKTENLPFETWMNIDEYENQESFEKFVRVFKKSNSDWAEFFGIEEKVKSLLYPNSMTHEVYIEKPELRID